MGFPLNHWTSYSLFAGEQKATEIGKNKCLTSRVPFRTLATFLDLDQFGVLMGAFFGQSKGDPAPQKRRPVAGSSLGGQFFTFTHILIMVVVGKHVAICSLWFSGLGVPFQRQPRHGLHVSLPFLPLRKPAHLEMDHWDRVASVGLMVPKALDHVQIQTAAWRVLVAEKMARWVGVGVGGSNLGES